MASVDLRDEVTCSICLNIYTDPVTLPCGHSFCRTCIGKAVDTQEARRYSCPECREKFSIKRDHNRTLRLNNIAESFQSAQQAKEGIAIPCTYCDSPVPAVKTCLHCEASLCDKHLKKHSKSAEHVLTEPTASLEKRKCSIHKKVLEYYCCEDDTCICVSCRLDGGEHIGHQVETLNEEKLRNSLQKLTSQREEVEKRVQSLEEHRRQMKEKAAGETVRVTALIRDIREQKDTLEKRVLREISRQEEQISLRFSDLIRQLEIKKEELSRKMGDIEELCDMTDPATVLQGRESDRADYCDTEEDTERRDIKVHDVRDLDVNLISVTLHSGLAGFVTRITRWRQQEASDMLLDVNTASDMLLDVNTASDMLLDVNTASDMLLDVNTASDMLLDVNTAGNCVSVSKDLKKVSNSGMYESRPETPERFQYNQVLSSRSFSSGRHYWEVKGSESAGWRVGMAYPSIERRGRQSRIGNNNKSWGLEKCYSNLFSLKHDSKTIRLPHPPSCCRFRIFLDYEVGCLSFYELSDPIRHLHTFTATFTEPLHAVFGVDTDSWIRVI